MEKNEDKKGDAMKIKVNPDKCFGCMTCVNSCPAFEKSTTALRYADVIQACWIEANCNGRGCCESFCKHGAIEVTR